MRTTLRRIAPVLFLPLLLGACVSIPDFDDTPQISFNSLSTEVVVDGLTLETVTEVTIRVDFEDGDADLGLDPTDTIPPFNPWDTISTMPLVLAVNPDSRNFEITIEQKSAGVWSDVVLTTDLGGRFPRLTELDGPISGFIDYKFQLAPSEFNSIFSDGDTLRYRCFIKDRALRQSNEITTGEMIYDGSL